MVSKLPPIVWQKREGGSNELKSFEQVFLTGSVKGDLFLSNPNMTALFIPRDVDNNKVVQYYTGAENVDLYFLGLVQSFSTPQMRDVVEFRSLGSSKLKRIFGYTNNSFSLTRLYTPYNILHAIYGDESNYNDELHDGAIPAGSGDDYFNFANPIFTKPFSIVQIKFDYDIENAKIQPLSMFSYTNAIIKSISTGYNVGALMIVEQVSGSFEKVIPLKI